jgi:hypothetical protein
VHLNVADLEGSIRFYTELFAAPPTVRKDDYAKWMLDDPRVNFAISNTGVPRRRPPRVAGRFRRGSSPRSASAWTRRRHRRPRRSNDPVLLRAIRQELGPKTAGTRWKTFHTFGEATHYYAADAACPRRRGMHAEGREMKPKVDKGVACCAPASGVADEAVLFVCVENANRSQMAEAFAHMLGGADVEALSAVRGLRRRETRRPSASWRKSGTTWPRTVPNRSTRSTANSTPS